MSTEIDHLICVGEKLAGADWVSCLNLDVCDILVVPTVDDISSFVKDNTAKRNTKTGLLAILCENESDWRQIISGLGDLSVPVIVIGGDLDDEHIRLLFDQGVADYVPASMSCAMSIHRVKLCIERVKLVRGIRERDTSIGKLMDDLQRVILPIGIALSVEKDVDRLMDRILEEAKKLCRADAGTLYLRTEANELRFAIMKTDSLGIGFGGTTGRSVENLPRLPLYDADGNENNHNIATHVALTGESVNIVNIYDSKDFDWAATRRFDAKNNYKSISTLTVPLKDSVGKVIGVLQLFNSIDENTGLVTNFTEYQQLVFESLASQAAIVLANQTLLKSEQELMLVRRELEIGRQIQASFIPQSLPEFNGWDIAATFSPAREVAGDFYDVIVLNEKKLMFVVADVCDKGVGAALYASLTRSLIRSFAQQCVPKGAACSAKCVHCTPEMMGDFLLRLAETSEVEPMNPMCTLNMTNDYLIEIHGDMNMFVTLFVGMIDSGEGSLTYINGGHEAPLILSKDNMIKGKLGPTGPAVGIVPKANYKAKKIVMESGESLVVFTDGIVDARNNAGQLFSRDRLVKRCCMPFNRASETLDNINGAVREHIGSAEQFDDITLMVVRRTL